MRNTWPPSSLFQTLADPTRLRILRLIAEDKVCVCYFVEALELSQSKISRHLAFLRRSGIVHARKDGKWVHYSIVFPSNPAAAAILREALAWTTEIPETSPDRVPFVAACCRPQRFVTLRGSPPPGPASEIISKAPAGLIYLASGVRGLPFDHGVSTHPHHDFDLCDVPLLTTFAPENRHMGLDALLLPHLGRHHFHAIKCQCGKCMGFRNGTRRHKNVHVWISGLQDRCKWLQGEYSGFET